MSRFRSDAARPVALSGVPRDARILIVDDEQANITLLKRLLERHGFSNFQTTTDPRDAAALYTKLPPDLVLLDLHMPHMDGLEVVDQLNQLTASTYLPILMLTGDMTPEARREALSRGAKDFVNKPFNSDEVILRIGTLLQTRFLYRQIQEHNEKLETRVRQRTEELDKAQLEILDRLALAAEFRDDNTGKHTLRVGDMAARLAREIGLPDARVDLIHRAAPLHDIGKIGIPDAILLKLGKLTPEEYEQVKEHTRIGGKILSGSQFALLQMAEEIALYHHEHWDGTGYEGLKGEAIPLSGRIVAVADVFDALMQQRPYKAAWTLQEATAEIQRQSGLHFDPRLVEAFMRVGEPAANPL